MPEALDDPLSSSDRASAIRQLPVTYAVAIRLRDIGVEDHLIGIALDVEENQVSSLVTLAEHKLQSLMEQR